MSKAKLEPVKFSELFHVGSRFGRSVNLERDFYDQVSLDGYVVTTTARDSLRRLAEAASSLTGGRAWTLTGAFGSGKSAFALFAAKALSPGTSPDAQSARDLLKESDKELWQSLFDRRRKTALGDIGLCPVLISGSREPLIRALLRGLATSVERIWTRNPPLLLTRIKRTLESMEAGDVMPSRQVVELFEEAAERVVVSKKAGGLLIVVDELGKILEYSAAHPHDSDIFLLQELAEVARRKRDHNIFLVTILHQSFDRYVERLGRAQKDEWTKVQGRFEDIPFQEPVDQLLRVLSQAIEVRGSSPHVEALRQYSNKRSRQAQELKLIAHSSKQNEAIEVLAACAPLHPTVALLLGKLFRRIGQNERSLFAFLTSHEPHGFQKFLDTTIWESKLPEMLRLDQLYDYIVAALGSALYVHADGRKWAEIDAALSRFSEVSELETKLIKAVGLLRVVGDLGNLKSSAAVLKFAFESEKTKPEEIDSALEHLNQTLQD